MPGGKRGGKSATAQKLPSAEAGANKHKHKDTEMSETDKISEPDPYELDLENDVSPQLAQAGLSGDLPLLDLPRGRGKKRPLQETGDSMQGLIAGFGADVTKNLEAKKKKLETFTHASLKASNTKVEKIWKAQQTERQLLGDEYNHQSLAVLNQWEADIQKSKEAEEKLLNMFKQQQKVFQQQRVVQAQRLKTIKQLQEQFMKSMKDLDTCHHKQQASMQTELKKEMGLLQKKLLMETQNQEISNVRRSLQSMLAQV